MPGKTTYLGLNTALHDDIVNHETHLNENWNKIDNELNKNEKKNNAINLGVFDKGYKGLCVRSWETNSFYSARFRENMVTKAKELHVDTIELIVNTYQPGITSNLPANRVPISLKEVEDYIVYLKDQGFKILFKHHVEVDADTYFWRGDIDPTDSNLWFTNYTNLMVSYAQLCEKYNVELFSVGSEYRTLTTKYPNKWREVIGSVKAVYTGALTYGANAAGDNGADEINTISFWDELDYIGADYYVNPTSNLNATKEEIIKSFYQNGNKHNNVLNVDRLVTRFKKPFLLAEYGYGTTVNLSYQTTYLDALLTVFSNKDYYKGGFLWVYDPFDTDYVNEGVTGVIVKHHKARAKAKTPTLDLYSTSENQTGSEKWVKIASASLLYGWTTASVTLSVEALTPNTQKQVKGELYLRVGADDSLSTFVECRLNSETALGAGDVGYLKNGNIVEFYLKVDTYMKFVYQKISSNGVDIFDIYDNPSLINKPLSLSNGSKINYATYPQVDGVVIQSGRVTITGNGGNNAYVDVTFPNAHKTVPNVTATAHNISFVVCIDDTQQTTNSVRIFVSKKDGSNFTDSARVQWISVG